jgi:hypothetical protein
MRINFKLTRMPIFRTIGLNDTVYAETAAQKHKRPFDMAVPDYFMGMTCSQKNRKPKSISKFKPGIQCQNAHAYLHALPVQGFLIVSRFPKIKFQVMSC